MTDTTRSAVARQLARDDVPELRALAEIERWPGRRHAAGAVGRDGVLGLRGDLDEVFPLASVTKLVTAFTVLRLVADGTVDLDEPAGPPDATVRHLLAHAAGYPFDGTEPMQPVGRRRVYSNTGFEVLAEHVEEVTGLPFRALVFDRTLAPLGMEQTALDGSPAKDGRGTIRDLLRFAHELLVPTLLPPWLHAQATSVAYAPLAGVLPGFGRQDPNPWGLGLEVRGEKTPHWTGSRNAAATFGHFGQSGSFLWVDPVNDVALAGLADEPFGPWAAEAWPRLSDAVIDEVVDG